MRLYRLLIILVLPVLLYCSSCSKDLNINADWKDIPVVYSLISQGDTTHYIKVTKAFLGEGNSLVYAQIPDSNNYPVADMQVRIDGYDGSNLIQTLYFHDTLIQNKDTGIFYSPTQLVYKAKGILNENYTYKLSVKNTRKNFEVTSQTSLVHTFSITKPQGQPEKANFMPGHKFTWEWYPAKNGKRYQALMRFHYLETKNGVSEFKYVDWLMFKDVTADYNALLKVTQSIMGDGFYNFLAAKLTPGGDSIYRVAREAEFFMTVGSPDLDLYMEVTAPSNTIIQERPQFTNITNGIGLFTSRLTAPVIVEQLTDNTKEEMVTNPATKDLNFRTQNK